MITDYLGMVKAFHEKYGHTIQSDPCFPHPDVQELRRKLISEEAEEFNDASENLTLIEIADALADLLYVVFGTALSYGIPIDKVFSEVHRSNMTKSMLKDEKSIRGKTIKGPDYEPPRIREVMGL